MPWPYQVTQLHDDISRLVVFRYLSTTGRQQQLFWVAMTRASRNLEQVPGPPSPQPEFWQAAAGAALQVVIIQPLFKKQTGRLGIWNNSLHPLLQHG